MIGGMIASSAICVAGPSPKPSIIDLLGTELLPVAYEQGDPTPAMLEDLLAETMSLMASHNLTVRETVKDALGHDLPLSCGSLMFGQLAK
jgi:neurofibromin 1